MVAESILVGVVIGSDGFLGLTRIRFGNWRRAVGILVILKGVRGKRVVWFGE